MCGVFFPTASPGVTHHIFSPRCYCSCHSLPADCALLTQPYMDMVPSLLCSRHGDSQQQKLCHWITSGLQGEITNALWSSSKRKLKLQSEWACIKCTEHSSPPSGLSCRDGVIASHKQNHQPLENSSEPQDSGRKRQELWQSLSPPHSLARARSSRARSNLPLPVITTHRTLTDGLGPPNLSSLLTHWAARGSSVENTE